MQKEKKKKKKYVDPNLKPELATWSSQNLPLRVGGRELQRKSGPLQMSPSVFCNIMCALIIKIPLNSLFISNEPHLLSFARI